MAVVVGAVLEPKPVKDAVETVENGAGLVVDVPNNPVGAAAVPLEKEPNNPVGAGVGVAVVDDPNIPVGAGVEGDDPNNDAPPPPVVVVFDHDGPVDPPGLAGAKVNPALGAGAEKLLVLAPKEKAILFVLTSREREKNSANLLLKRE